MSGHEVSAQAQAAWSMREQIRQVAVEVFGATRTESPIEGMQVVTRPGLDDPLAGLRAAALARDVAAGQLCRYAEAARGAGRSWDDIGAALDISADDDPRGELAFALLIEGRPLPEPQRSLWMHRPRARWSCTSCGQRVTDDGPYAANPADNETGHAPDCARHAAEVAAFHTEWFAD